MELPGFAATCFEAVLSHFLMVACPSSRFLRFLPSIFAREHSIWVV